MEPIPQRSPLSSAVSELPTRPASYENDQAEPITEPVQVPPVVNVHVSIHQAEVPPTITEDKDDGSNERIDTSTKREVTPVDYASRTGSGGGDLPGGAGPLELPPVDIPEVPPALEGGSSPKPGSPSVISSSPELPPAQATAAEVPPETEPEHDGELEPEEKTSPEPEAEEKTSPPDQAAEVDDYTGPKVKIYNGKGRRHNDRQIDEILDWFLLYGDLPTYVTPRQRRDYKKHPRLQMRRLYLEQAGFFKQLHESTRGTENAV